MREGGRGRCCMFATIRLVVACAVAFAIGACSSKGSTRTVSGTFMITYQPETGSPTSVPAPPRADPYLLGHHWDSGYQLQGLLVPDGSPSGYASFSGTLGRDFSFSIPDVPSASYFLT